MKRKIISIFLALAFSIVLLLTTGVPVMAAKPEENNGIKPVAWINYSGASGVIDGKDHMFSSIVVKKLSDGTTVGHFIMQEERGSRVEEVNVVDSYFHEEANGIKVADLLTESDGWYIWWTLSDAGEPGRPGDTWNYHEGVNITGWDPLIVSSPGDPREYPSSNYYWPPVEVIPDFWTGIFWCPLSYNEDLVIGPYPILTNIQIHVDGAW
jgi:hypothetical protein